MFVSTFVFTCVHACVRARVRVYVRACEHACVRACLAPRQVSSWYSPRPHTLHAVHTVSCVAEHASVTNVPCSGDLAVIRPGT